MMLAFDWMRVPSSKHQIESLFSLKTGTIAVNDHSGVLFKSKMTILELLLKKMIIIPPCIEKIEDSFLTLKMNMNSFKTEIALEWSLMRFRKQNMERKKMKLVSGEWLWKVQWKHFTRYTTAFTGTNQQCSPTHHHIECGFMNTGRHFDACLKFNRWIKFEIISEKKLHFTLRSWDFIQTG